MEVPSLIPAAQGAESEESQVQDWPGQVSETVSKGLGM